MSGRGTQPGQGFLFGDPHEPDGPASRVAPAPPRPDWLNLGGQLPQTVRLGTSSWTFPGWRGLVYDREHKTTHLAERDGISAYAHHPLLRTVGLDRAFYALQTREQFADLRASVPAGFRFLVKANQLATRPLADERGRTYGDTATLHEPNALFLDPAFAAERIITPAIEGLGDACGPIVFQFPPLDLSPRGPIGSAAKLIDRLDTFLARLPKVPAPACIAVEVRNRALICPDLAAVLQSHTIAHGYAHHPTLPSVDAQAVIMNNPRTPLVCRWLLRHGQQYEGAKSRYEPFDKIVDPDGPALLGIADLVRESVRQAREAYVIVNNKAEGSAPLSVARLAHAVVNA